MRANSTKVQNRSLERKLEKVELQTEDQAAAKLQNNIILGGNALPSVSDDEMCGQVAKKVIRAKLNISFPNEVIVAA